MSFVSHVCTRLQRSMCVIRMSNLAVVSEKRPDRNTEVGVQHVKVQRDKVGRKQEETDENSAIDLKGRADCGCIEKQRERWCTDDQHTVAASLLISFVKSLIRMAKPARVFMQGWIICQRSHFSEGNIFPLPGNRY